jgi:hypothetical protein
MKKQYALKTLFGFFLIFMQCKTSRRHPKCRLHITYILNVPLGRLIVLKNVLLPTPQDPQQRFRDCKSTAYST